MQYTLDHCESISKCVCAVHQKTLKKFSLLCSIAFACLKRSRVHSFLLEKILVKTMSRKFQGICARSFGGSVKYCYCLRLHNARRGRTVNTSKWRCFLFFWWCCQNMFIWAENSQEHLNCVKRGRIRSYFGPSFPAFKLITGRYSVSFRIQSECGKMRTRMTPNTDIFHAA